MPNPVGRPTIVTPEVLNKLEEAFALDCTDAEACLYADISMRTLYNYQTANPDFLQRKNELKQTPFLMARTTVVNAIRRDPDMALKYLERKLKSEFAPKSDLSVEVSHVLGYIHSGDIKQEEPKELPDGTSPSI